MTGCRVSWRWREQYGVSRDVIRRAKEVLAGEGWLIVLHGRGTFVARPDPGDSD